MTSATGASSDEADAEPTINADRDTDEITQEEKPRSRIIAEYLAHGYVVGDAAIQRAIELDHQHGVTTRFFNKLNELDGKYHATDRAKATDESYGITQRATTFSSTVFSGLNSYFEKATNTATGKKLVDFCKFNLTSFCLSFSRGGFAANHISTTPDSQRQKELQDVHTEARRLAELKKQEHGGSAYKASGLERFLGAEKPKTEAPSSGPGAPAAPGATTTSETAQPPKSAADAGLGNQESTPISSEKTG